MGLPTMTLKINDSTLYPGYSMPIDHCPVKGRNGVEKFFQNEMKNGVANIQVEK
jgi:hypothetical protein